MQFWLKASWGTILWKNFEFGPVVQEEMSFKDISYLELWWPFCSTEWNHLFKFSRGYYEEQFCEIILNLDQWFRRRCLLKIFLIWSSAGTFVQWSGTICAILVEGIMKNNSVQLFWIRSLSWSSGSPFALQSGTICAILVGGTILWSYFKFGPVVQGEMSFKRFLFWSFGSPPVPWRGTIYAIFEEASWGTFMWSYMKIRPVVLEEMSFKEKVYGWRKTDDGNRCMTDQSQYLTFGSGDLKM